MTAASDQPTLGRRNAARTLSLEVFGQRISVVSDADDDRVRQVVAFVNRRFEDLQDGTKRVQTDHIALLTALNLAEELFEERDRREALKVRVRERSSRLLASVDAASRELDLKLEADERPDDQSQ